MDFFIFRKTYGAICFFFHQRFDLFLLASVLPSLVSIFSSSPSFFDLGVIGKLARFVRRVLTIP
jgi:hypothetical protein